MIAVNSFYTKQVKQSKIFIMVIFAIVAYMFISLFRLCGYSPEFFQIMMCPVGAQIIQIVENIDLNSPKNYTG